MDTKKAEELIDKFNKGILSPEEEAMLDSWYLSWYKDEQGNITDEDLQGRKVAVLSKLDSRYHKSLKIILWPRIAVVAAAVAAIVFGVWFYTSRINTTRHPEFISGSPLANDIAPGHNGATLTLANGKVIDLSDAKLGVIVGNDLRYNDNTAVIPTARSDEGSPGHATSRDLSYRRDDVQQFTASTAKGQTYQIILPDGTRVWLNADSKISFPSQFVGKERKILLSGEGYFEVTKNKAKPFIVQTDKQTVEVLGTHFNINGYSDEGSVKTTLLEGSVRVTSFRGNEKSPGHTTSKDLSYRRDDGEEGERNAIILKPNQQSVLTGFNRIMVKEVDVSEAVAWKNGEFVFKGETLENIMRKVARWYNVEVIYETDAPRDMLFGVFVSRSRNISAVLESLQNTGSVKFKIEEHRIIVRK